MINSDITPQMRNRALCRKDLDIFGTGRFTSQGYTMCEDMSYLKVNGLTKFWDEKVPFTSSTFVGDILNGQSGHDIKFAYIVTGDENGIKIYIGTETELLCNVKNSYEAVFPGIDLDEIDYDPLKNAPARYGGMFMGIPTNKTTGENHGLQIENICRGMNGCRFIYVILACGVGNIIATLGHEEILREMEKTYCLINQTISGGALGNISAQKQDFQAKNYFENLEKLEKNLNVGVSRGIWRVNGYYASDNEMDAYKLGNIIKSCYSGEDSHPEPFRTIEYERISEVIHNTYFMADTIQGQNAHPLGIWSTTDFARDITLYIYKFQTVLNSDQLAVMCQLPIKEFPGYYTDDFVEFDVSDRTGASMEEPVVIGDICIAGRKDNITEGNKYCIEKNDFTRHALVIGITGGGKTNTSKSILSTLWNEKKIPFLVIESAKREYWELRNIKGFEDIMVFTLGAEAKETSVKYRINPFETSSGISLQTHIDYLLSTFKAAFDLYPPMPYVLEKAVYAVYADRGWDIVENINTLGRTEYPTLTDLYNKIDVIVDELGYHNEVQSNVKAALQARIYSLMIGGKGAMLNTRKSVPIDKILKYPVVMELEDIGDDDIKSFVIGIVLVQLYEYRKTQMTSGSKKLSHILMVEEAHRLLKNVSEGGEGGNPRAKSVEFFCNMLAEIRTFGQGILIADQIPTKLAPDTIKNTNLKIVHRTVAHEDRETIGKAMNMSQEQIDYLSSLRRGYAAVYAEGDNRPKCVKFPLVSSEYAKTRNEVIREVKNKVYCIAHDYDDTVSHHIGCTFCEERCNYYTKVNEYITKNIDVEKVMGILNTHHYSDVSLRRFINSSIMKGLDIHGINEQICVLGYILSKNKTLNDGWRQKYISDYIKLTKNGG